MDIQMADPTPLRSLEKKLSLSPRHAVSKENSNLRQPALRANIFEAASLREAGATLFPTQQERDAGHVDDFEDEPASPTKPKQLPVSGDPFKLPRPVTRPGLLRQRTMPVNATVHERTKSTSNLERPSSPRRAPAKGMAVSPARRAPPVPSIPSPTALGANRSKEDMLKAIQRGKIQGRTLVELNMAEMNQPRSSGGPLPVNDRLTGKLVPPTRFEPLWDPERDEMPSPFLVKTRKTIASR